MQIIANVLPARQLSSFKQVSSLGAHAARQQGTWQDLNAGPMKHL